MDTGASSTGPREPSGRGVTSRRSVARLSQALLTATFDAAAEATTAARCARGDSRASLADAACAASAASAEAVACGETPWSATAFNAFSRRMSAGPPPGPPPRACAPGAPAATDMVTGSASALGLARERGSSITCTIAAAAAALQTESPSPPLAHRAQPQADGPAAGACRAANPAITVEERSSGGPSTHRTDSGESDRWAPNGTLDTRLLTPPDPRDSWYMWDDDDADEAARAGDDDDELEYDEDETVDFNGDGRTRANVAGGARAGGTDPISTEGDDAPSATRDAAAGALRSKRARGLFHAIGSMRERAAVARLQAAAAKGGASVLRGEIALGRVSPPGVAPAAGAGGTAAPNVGPPIPHIFSHGDIPQTTGGDDADGAAAGGGGGGDTGSPPPRAGAAHGSETPPRAPHTPPPRAVTPPSAGQALPPLEALRAQAHAEGLASPGASRSPSARSAHGGAGSARERLLADAGNVPPPARLPAADRHARAPELGGMRTADTPAESAPSPPAGAGGDGERGGASARSRDGAPPPPHALRGGGAAAAYGATPGRPGEGVLKPGDARARRPERAIALAFLAALCASALIGSVLVLLPCALFLLPLPLAPARALYRAIANAVAASWFTFASALIETLAGVRLRVSGPGGGPRLMGERVAILICNHHCRVDWLFLWPLACRMLSAGRLKIALRDDMKRMPFFGWAMQAFLFVFLSRRNRPLDLLRIERTLGYLVHERDEPVLLLLFPEGSDLSPQNAQRDAAYATRAGERVYRHVLHPRTAGFAHAVKTLGDRLDAVYDATLWYERHPDEAAAGARPSERTLFKGTFPRTVSAHVERFGRASLPPPDDEAALGEWLKARWAVKEAMLDKLLVDGVPPPRARRSHPSLGSEYRLALVGWGGAVVLLCAGLVRWLPLAIYVAVGMLAFHLITTLVGGVDSIELALRGCVAPAIGTDGAAAAAAVGARRAPSRLAARGSPKARAHQF